MGEIYSKCLVQKQSKHTCQDIVQRSLESDKENIIITRDSPTVMVLYCGKTPCYP